MTYVPGQQKAVALDSRLRAWASKLKGSKKRRKNQDERAKYVELRKKSAEDKKQQEIEDPDITHQIELLTRNRGKAIPVQTPRIVTMKGKERAVELEGYSNVVVTKPLPPRTPLSTVVNTGIFMSGGLAPISPIGDVDAPERGRTLSPGIETNANYSRAFSQASTSFSDTPAPRNFHAFSELSNGEGSASQRPFSPPSPPQRPAPSIPSDIGSEPSTSPVTSQQDPQRYTTNGGPSQTAINSVLQPPQRQSTFDRLLGISPVEAAEASLLPNTKNPYLNGMWRTYLLNKDGAGSEFITKMEESIFHFEVG